jgi:hypothetical protein
MEVKLITNDGNPTGGTWTWDCHWHGRVGTSDRLPYNCTGAQANAAFKQACERAGMFDTETQEPQ